MGTWGPRIFDDDTACDTRFEYRDLLSHGATGPQATDHMIQIHATGPDFGGYQLTFWLALAATQSRLGRLEDRVRDTVLQIIDSGEDLAAWDQPGPTFLRRRRGALQRLRRRLLGPQPAPVPVKQRWRQTTELQPGQHVLYRRRDGRRMLLRVMDVEHYGACTYPMVMVLSWRDGEPLPSGQTLTQLGSAHAFSHGEPMWFSVKRRSPTDGIPKRLEVLRERWDGPLPHRHSWLPCNWDELGDWAPPPVAAENSQG
jgi:hypothetical protein